MTPPKAGRQLTGSIPDAVTASIDGAGHMMMVEAPDACLTALRCFLAAG